MSRDYFLAGSIAASPPAGSSPSRFHRRASSTSRAVTFADFERLAFAVIPSRLKNFPASSGTMERGKTWLSAMPSPVRGLWVIVGDPPCRSSLSPASVKHPNSSSFARLQIIDCLSALAAAVPRRSAARRRLAGSPQPSFSRPDRTLYGFGCQNGRFRHALSRQILYPNLNAWLAIMTVIGNCYERSAAKFALPISIGQ